MSCFIRENAFPIVLFATEQNSRIILSVITFIFIKNADMKYLMQCPN